MTSEPCLCRAVRRVLYISHPVSSRLVAQGQVCQKRIRYLLYCAGSTTDEKARQGASGKPGGRVSKDHLAPDWSTVGRGSLYPRKRLAKSFGSLSATLYTASRFDTIC